MKKQLLALTLMATLSGSVLADCTLCPSKASCKKEESETQCDAKCTEKKCEKKAE